MAITTILGTVTANTLRGTPGADSISALAGDDTISGLGGADTIFGGKDADVIDQTEGGGLPSTANANNSGLFGDLGNDTINLIMQSTAATLRGGKDDDEIAITRNFASGLVNGDADNDSIYVEARVLNSFFYGGIGNDTLDITLDGNSSNFQVWGDSTQDDSSTSSIVALDDEIYVYGYSGNEQISGMTVMAGAGDDYIDIADGEFVNALVQGNKGDDTIYFHVHENISITNGQVFGGKGNDSIDVGGTTWEGPLSAAFEGGEMGFGYSAGSATGVQGDDGNDTIYVSNIEKATVYGGKLEDRLDVRDADGAYVSGDKGNDSLAVYGMNKAVVLGGDGADSFELEGSYSSIVGGAGNDRFGNEIYGNDVFAFNHAVTSSTFFFGFGSGADTFNADLGANTVIALSSQYGSTVGLQASQGTISFGGGNSITFAVGSAATFITVSDADITKLG